jgi:protein-disulfide isomerase
MITDSDKLTEILKLVREIREYIGTRPDCPQHLWTAERAAAEAQYQRFALGLPPQQFGPGDR